MPPLPAAGSVTANIRLMSAVAPEVMNCLAPFRTYLLPCFSARVFRFEASEPACGSVSEKAALISPRASGFKKRSFWSVEP